MRNKIQIYIYCVLLSIYDHGTVYISVVFGKITESLQQLKDSRNNYLSYIHNEQLSMTNLSNSNVIQTQKKLECILGTLRPELEYMYIDVTMGLN